MTARADVKHSVIRRGLDIVLSPLPGRIINWGIPANEELKDGLMPSTEQILNLPEDSARALYEALHRYFGGGEAGTTRQDLLAERARVDKLLDSLLSTHTTARAV